MLSTEAYGSDYRSLTKDPPSRIAFHKREHFILDPEIYITSVSDLSPNRWYRRGSLRTGVTPAISPAQFGGQSCADYPTPIYQYLVPTTDQAATCIFGDSRVYKVDPSLDECVLSNGNYYTQYVLKTDAELDAVDTSATGVTQTASQYNGVRCSDRVKMDPATYPLTKLLGQPCAAQNAVCRTTDEDIYTVDPGMTAANCTITDARNLYFRSFGKRTDLEALTTTRAKNGGLTCTQQIGPTSTTYPASKVVGSGTIAPSYCTRVDAVCKTSDADIYSFLPITSTGSADWSSCTRSTTDNLWYRPILKQTNEVLDSATITTTPAQFGGRTCSQQIGPTTTTYPFSKIMGSGTSALSYCPPQNAVCGDVVQSNMGTNYDFSTSTPFLGSTVPTS